MKGVMRLFKKSNSILQNRWCFLLPSFLGVAVFVLIPFGWVVITSFYGRGDSAFAAVVICGCAWNL